MAQEREAPKRQIQNSAPCDLCGHHNAICRRNNAERWGGDLILFLLFLFFFFLFFFFFSYCLTKLALLDKKGGGLFFFGGVGNFGLYFVVGYLIDYTIKRLRA